jgi:hypothetical protein|tara:strand:+ start:629 stop:865 length:237 start_codon:yes stop_codon:yes gene_type:complete
MNFVEIKEDGKVFPGEYLLYEPTQTIVLCGAFNRESNMIRAYGNGKYVEDKIKTFKKIEVTRKQQKEQYKSRCKGCGG